MGVMSARHGYKYLLGTPAAADDDRSLSIPLTRDYTEEGTAPGTWMGSALHNLGNGGIGGSDEVSGSQLQLPHHATAFDHDDSRSSDPQLRTPLIVSSPPLIRFCSLLSRSSGVAPA